MSEPKRYVPPDVAIQAGDVVFIDTCIFDSFKYSFDSTYFKSLESHRAALGFVVVISAVVEREVLSHIDRDFSGLHSAADKLNTQVGSDYSSHFENIISELKQRAVETKEVVLAAWGQFKAALGVVVLPFELVTMQDIFERYFDVSPPFDAKTKSEIPDAFSAIAIEKYQAQNSSGQIVIISTDGIFSKCGELYPNWFVFKRLQDFLDSIARTQPTLISSIVVEPTVLDLAVENTLPPLELIPLPAVPVPTPSLPVAVNKPRAPDEVTQEQGDEPEEDPVLQARLDHDALMRVVSLNTGLIEQAIFDYVGTLAFEIHGGFAYEDEQVEVSEVRLKSFRIDEIKADEQWARIAVDISLNADVSFSCSVWDSVDREYVFLDSSSGSISGAYSGFVEISYEAEDIDVVDVEFEALNNLSVEGELSNSFYE